MALEGASNLTFSNQAVVEKLVQGNMTFTFHLFEEIRKSGSENIFISPASITAAMAMTYLGASGNTEKEMQSVLALPDVSSEHLHQSFNEIITSLHKQGSNLQLHMANRLYMEQSHNFLAEFLQSAQTHYKAEPVLTDFAKGIEKSREEINKWVEEQTVAKIKDLIPSGALNSLTRLVLVNAIYFKGDWMQKFDQAATQPEDFSLAGGSSIKVPMMFQERKFNSGFSKELDAKILELPYDGQSLSMFILLPNQVDGLQSLEMKLKAHDLIDLSIFQLKSIKIKVKLPKFKLEQSVNLKAMLSIMGMKDLFDDGRADLSKVDGSKLLYVSEIFHKAFIDVNEEGSEAAAATAVVMQMRCIMRTPEFYADHPFLFFIRDNHSKMVLFLGRMSNPGGK